MLSHVHISRWFLYKVYSIISVTRVFRELAAKEKMAEVRQKLIVKIK